MFETCLVTARVPFCEFHVFGSPERDSSSLGVMARGLGRFLGLFAYRHARFLDSSDLLHHGRGRVAYPTATDSPHPQSIFHVG